MLVRYGGWCSAVRCSAVQCSTGRILLAGWLRSRVRLQLQLRSEAVSVSVTDNVSPLPPFPLCPALLCVFFLFFVLLGLVEFADV
jgi:hypothetical protein